MVSLLDPRHSPPKLVLVCVGATTSNIDALSHCAIWDTDSTVCIYLYYWVRTFGRTVQLSINVITCDEYFITYLIIMRDS